MNKIFFATIASLIILTGAGCSNDQVIRDQQKKIDELTNTIQQQANTTAALQAELKAKPTVVKTEDAAWKIEKCKAQMQLNSQESQRVLDQTNAILADAKEKYGKDFVTASYAKEILEMVRDDAEEVKYKQCILKS